MLGLKTRDHINVRSPYSDKTTHKETALYLSILSEGTEPL